MKIKTSTIDKSLSQKVTQHKTLAGTGKALKGNDAPKVKCGSK